MDRVAITDATPADGGVFIDNLLLASVRRALTGAYGDIAGNPELHPAAGPGIFAHDLVNLANFVEALVCHEHLYVNAAFAELWRRDLEGLAPQLESLITGVEWTREWQWEAESAVVKNKSWSRPPRASDFGLRELSSVVAISTHHVGSARGIVTYGDSLGDLTAYSERTRPFGSGMDLVAGTGFYTTCSQILGVPYRPSLLRSLYLRSLLKESVRDFREDVGRLAFGMLEQAREGSIEFVAQLADMNWVEAQMPAVLAWVLSRANSREDVLPCTLALRETAGARRFREWNGALVRAVQSGDLTDAARRFREMADLVRDVNRNLGFDEGGEAFIGLGWGPASVGKTFNLPARLNLPIRFKRHAAFLQDVYKTMLSIGRLEDFVNALIVKPLPASLQQMAAAVDWRKVASTFHDYGGIYEPS